MRYRLKAGWCLLEFMFHPACLMVGLAFFMNCVQIAIGPFWLNITVLQGYEDGPQA